MGLTDASRKVWWDKQFMGRCLLPGDRRACRLVVGVSFMSARGDSLGPTTLRFSRMLRARVRQAPPASWRVVRSAVGGSITCQGAQRLLVCSHYMLLAPRFHRE